MLEGHEGLEAANANLLGQVTVTWNDAETSREALLEAMARGVPVVQPAHGSFPELLGLTGGGVLVPPGDASALAYGIAELLRDEPRRR